MKYVISAIVALLLIGVIIFFSVTPSGVALWNSWFFTVQKVDDATDYQTIKTVEDTCRAMISSYNADKLTYEQYKDSTNSEEHAWANQAKMRANRTAIIYNNYILQNSFVWNGNVPIDISVELRIID